MPTQIGPALSAADILAEAGLTENLEFVGPFDSAAERAVLTVPQLITAAWRANDAGKFAATFTEDGSLLMRDEQLTSREQIHAHMAAGFDGGPYAGAFVTGWPLHITFLATGVAMIVTQGGIHFGGDPELRPANEIRAIWITKAQDGRWRLVSHQSNPVAS